MTRTADRESAAVTRSNARPTAALYRMDMPDHLCPFGLKSLDLLRRQGFHVEDHRLTGRRETDQFMQAQGVQSTPQTFIDGIRVGGWDDLRRHFGQRVPSDQVASYQPVVVVFVMTALMAIMATWGVNGFPTLRTFEWFVAFSMCVLALLKLRDLESFSNMFLGYDLLARRVVRYAYIYPFAEGMSGILMIGGAWPWLSGPIATFIGAVGAISVVKAVYVDRRSLTCACVGGDSRVPLGLISLVENLMMTAMGLWTLAKLIS